MKKKVLVVSLIAVLLAIALVGGTLAYFTDEEEVKNTMSIGDVDLILTETSDAKDGVVGTAKTGNVTGFDYTNMVPGTTYAKRATLKLSNEAFEVNAKVFAELIVSNNDELYDLVNAANAAGGEYASAKLNADDLAGTFLENCNLPVSAIVGGFVDSEGMHVIYYLDEWTPGHEEVLFTGITVPAKLDQSLSKVTKPVDLTVKGYAIQSANVPDVKTAYDQFFTQGWINE